MGALTARAGVSQPAVSKHLGVLKQAGLVRDRHQGRQTHYSPQLGALAPLVDWTSRMAGFWQNRFDRLEDFFAGAFFAGPACRGFCRARSFAHRWSFRIDMLPTGSYQWAGLRSMRRSRDVMKHFFLQGEHLVPFEQRAPGRVGQRPEHDVMRLCPHVDNQPAI